MARGITSFTAYTKTRKGPFTMYGCLQCAFSVQRRRGNALAGHALAVAAVKQHTERSHAINWDRVFDLRCKSKRGEQLTDAELVLIKRAHAEDRERYAALDDRVFEVTKPFGAKSS